MDGKRIWSEHFGSGSGFDVEHAGAKCHETHTRIERSMQAHSTPAFDVQTYDTRVFSSGNGPSEA